MSNLTKGRVLRIVRPTGNVYYARKGEMAYCENGHELGRIAHDMPHGEELKGNEIEGFRLLRYGECFPLCPLCEAFCTIGSEDNYDGGFLFKCEETGEIVGRL